MKKYLVLAASCAVISTLPHTNAGAENIDYSAMEELFGEPVTQSATGKPERMSDVPMTMEILTQDDIRRSGAVNIAEALRQVNGVNVVQRTSETYDVSIRGYNQYASQRLLVLVNGRQVYLDHYGYTNWTSIPVQMEEIRQIEVVKGPNTALYGFNAVNGVVNIVTYNPLYDDVSSAGATVGTQQYRKGHYVQSLKLNDNLATRISGSLMRARDDNNERNSAPAATANAGNNAGYTDPDSASFNMDTILQATSNSQFRLELSGNNNQSGAIVSSGFLTNDEYQTRAVKLSYDVDSDYGLIKANIYKNFMDWHIEGAASAFSADITNEVLVAQLEDIIQLNPNHTIRLQTEYRNNEYKYKDSPAASSESVDDVISYDIYAAGGMWSWKLNDDLTWTNAVRYDRLELDHKGETSPFSSFTDEDFNRTLNEISYNSGLHWHAGEKDIVRLSTARGLEVPSLTEFGISANSILPGPFVVVYDGNPYIKPAVVTNYELAWDHKIDKIDGLFRSAIFHNKTEDVKSLGARSIALFNLQSDNVGDSESYGIELALEGKIDKKYSWGIGYIYQEINDDLDNGKTQTDLDIPKEYEDSNPQHEIKLNLGYKDGPWEADALAYYVSKTEQFNTTATIPGTAPLEDIDDYIGLNARIGYTFDNDLTLAVHGQQLLRPQTQTSISPDIDRRAYVSLTKKF